MGIVRRVEYIRYCDVADCSSTVGSEAADWGTEHAAERAAIKDGWLKFGPNRWMCPKCREELHKERHDDQ